MGAHVPIDSTFGPVSKRDVKLNLSQAKGELRSYLKYGNEVWIYMDVAIILTGITTTTLSSWSFDARVSNQHLVRSTSF